MGPDKAIGEFGLAVGLIVFGLTVITGVMAGALKWIAAPLVKRHIQFLDRLELREEARDELFKQIIVNQELLRRAIEKTANGSHGGDSATKGK